MRKNKILNEFLMNLENFAKISNEFCENFEHIANIFKEHFREMNEIFRFRSHFCWLSEIFAKEIEQTFGNPSKNHEL